MMRLNRIHFLICCFLAVVLLVGIVQADVLQPRIVHVYFQKDGVPYNFPVKYTVTCYGYEAEHFPFTLAPPGSYQPSPIFRYSATCNGYGCPVYSQFYSLIGAHFDWCDLEGETNYQKFSLHNFSSTDITRCDRVVERTFKMQDNDLEFYYYTPEYDACLDFTNNKTREIWAGRANFSFKIPINGSMILLLKGRVPYYSTDDLMRTELMANKSEIPMNLDQYINYLESCDPISDRKCPGWIIDGKPLKSFTEFRTLRYDETDLRDNPCDTFLVKADPSLVIPLKDQDVSWRGACARDLTGCNYTWGICESRFTIPSAGDHDSIKDMTTPVIPVSRISPLPSVTSKTNTSVRATVIVSATGTLSTLPSTNNQMNTAFPTLNPPVPGGGITVHRGPVETLYCAILSWFRISCDAT